MQLHSELVLANLPQVLANAIDNEPGLSNKLKLICIDISKFIDPDNPAQENYDEILNQNCPEWQNGYPHTMQKLKLYWNYLRRISEIPLFFICYDSTALSTLDTNHLLQSRHNFYQIRLLTHHLINRLISPRNFI